MVPEMPVIATATAASEPGAPKRSAMGRAMGIVADFGINAISVVSEPPSTQPIDRAETMATTQPTSSAALMGSHSSLMRSRWAYSGIASATVAGPTNKVSSETPLR